MPEIHGFVEPKFQAVQDAFAANFEDQGEIGAACAVYLHGRPVVDVWAGVANPATGAEWQEGTAPVVASTSKGISAVCAAVLVDRGELDPKAPVAEYWPE